MLNYPREGGPEYSVTVVFSSDFIRSNLVTDQWSGSPTSNPNLLPFYSIIVFFLVVNLTRGGGGQNLLTTTGSHTLWCAAGRRTGGSVSSYLSLIHI